MSTMQLLSATTLFALLLLIACASSLNCSRYGEQCDGNTQCCGYPLINCMAHDESSYCMNSMLQMNFYLLEPLLTAAERAIQTNRYNYRSTARELNDMTRPSITDSSATWASLPQLTPHLNQLNFTSPATSEEGIAATTETTPNQFPSTN